MPLVHVIRTAWSAPGALTLDGYHVLTGSRENNGVLAIPGGVTDWQVPFTIVHDELVSLYVLLNGGLHLAIKANDPDEPDGTLMLNGGEPFWAAPDHNGAANPFTAAVHALYFTNPATFTVYVEIRALAEL